MSFEVGSPSSVVLPWMWPIWTLFSSFLTAFLMCQVHFEYWICLPWVALSLFSSEIELIYTFDEPILDSIFQVIEKTLKHPWNQRWPLQNITCYVTPGWHLFIGNLSLGMEGLSVHWLLLAQSNSVAKSVQEKCFAMGFTKIMQKTGWCCLEVESLL